MVLQSDLEDWSDAGVSVDVPEQHSKVKVRKVRRRLPSRTAVPSSPTFHLGRMVINFELVDDDYPDTTLTKFDPRFELRVRYTRNDWKRAEAAGQTPTLAFWNGKTWAPFTKEKHGFELRPDSNTDPAAGGAGYARISDWDDPAVGWGP